MLERFTNIEIEGFEGDLRVTRVTVDERAHATGSCEVIAATDDGAAAAVSLTDDLLGSRATLHIGPAERGRRIVGVVEAIEHRGTEVEILVVPRISRLADAVDFRTFLGLDAVAIVAELLAEHGLDLEDRTARKLPTRPSCTQAFESTLHFASRILAEEGVLWHVDSSTGIDVAVLTDAPSAREPLEGGEELPFGVAEAGGLAGPESMVEATLTHAMVPDAVTLTDYDFERPALDQTATAGAAAPGRERYEHPGGYVDPETGRALASIRLDELRGREVVLTARVTSCRLAPGRTFRLTGHPRGEMAGPWLVLEHRMEVRDGPALRGGAHRVEARVVAVPADRSYRPPRIERPRAAGLETGDVTGPDGAEIHTEAHARVKVRRRWERRRPADDSASHWVRVAHPPMSGGFLLPRVGWDVALAFEHDDPDRPIELGRLYTGDDPPGEGLPRGQVKGAFGTRTTPGGNSANGMATDDTAGAEKWALTASKNCNERTENNKSTSIEALDTWEVGGDETVIVGARYSLLVDGSQRYTVSGSRSFAASEGVVIEAGSEMVVAGMRLFQIGGDFSTKVGGGLARMVNGVKLEVPIVAQNRYVSGVSTTMVGGLWFERGASCAVSALGGSVLKSAEYNVRCSKYELDAVSLIENTGPRTDTAGGLSVLSAKGSLSLSLGDTTLAAPLIFIKAKSKVTVQSGGTKIIVTPSAVHIVGKLSSPKPAVSGGTAKHGS